MEEKYFVASNGEEPLKVFTNPIDAFVSGYLYIDSFDENGDHVKAYKFHNNEYVDEF